ncbi:uncharacterized protein FPRO_03853 [Fusarium proliferatum ET1]|uniref:Uncharacterized protein n=1 Tax=Fusarium proliferatum (strain ET1) TaxID=1227346 RepID=A0A1L7V4U4_FUSPR|nr:uncharacterized protein FPRO_03853 [Fusarium proliferatum ET1]CZR35887.1 uncharacterized protein FPRO_03853 [Fusarium proliferatum ET1]
MPPTGRKRTTVSSVAVTAESTKRVRLPNYAGDSFSTSRSQPGRLGSSARHALDGRGTTAPRRDKGSPVFSDTGLFVADDLDASGAKSSQPVSRKTLRSGQIPDADVNSSLPSSFLPDSTSHAIPSTDTADLLTQHALPSPELPDEQDLTDLPETLTKYEKKLKKFVDQWHASLVKKGIPEHLAYELAKRCVQTSDKEGDSETDSHNARRVEKPLFPPGTLLKGTQLFQASTQVLPHVLNNHGGDNEDSDIPSRPSANRILTQVSQTDDEPVVIRLGVGARAPKPGLGGGDKPITLVEALKAKNRLRNHSEEGHGAFDTLAVARRLQERDFEGRLSSQEICVIGIAVLHEVFGDRGQKRLADALTHLYGRHPRRHLADLDRNAGRVADEIREGGQATLSSFTLRWAQAVQHDSPNMLTIDDIRLIDMKVSLVREWDRWSNPAATGSNKDIEDFLVKNGIDTNAGLTLSTRIAKYLSRKLCLPEGTLAKKIYAWRPLAVMVDVFGPGIYVFVSRSLFTCYNKIRTTDGIKKEDKFRAMALAVADEIPDLLEICQASYAHVVQPVLESLVAGNNMMQGLSRDLRVPGVQMATDGDQHSLRKTSIPELLGICISPRGFVEELDSVTGGDADARTEMVRHRSNLHEHHHEDGKDSDGDNDDDDESGEEDDENCD